MFPAPPPPLSVRGRLHPRWDGDFWAGETKAQAETVKVVAEPPRPFPVEGCAPAAGQKCGAGMGGKGSSSWASPARDGKKTPEEGEWFTLETFRAFKNREEEWEKRGAEIKLEKLT